MRNSPNSTMSELQRAVSSRYLLNFSLASAKYNYHVHNLLLYKYQLFMSAKVERYAQGERLDCSISRAGKRVDIISTFTGI